MRLPRNALRLGEQKEEELRRLGRVADKDRTAAPSESYRIPLKPNI